MKLNMGKIEGLLFTFFCTFSMEALVIYSLTNNEGREVNDFLLRLIMTMILNFFILALIIAYEHVVKPLIYKPSSMTASSSVTHPDSFHFQDSGLSINVL